MVTPVSGKYTTLRIHIYSFIVFLVSFPDPTLSWGEMVWWTTSSQPCSKWTSAWHRFAIAWQLRHNYLFYESAPPSWKQSGGQSQISWAYSHAKSGKDQLDCKISFLTTIRFINLHLSIHSFSDGVCRKMFWMLLGHTVAKECANIIGEYNSQAYLPSIIHPCNSIKCYHKYLSRSYQCITVVICLHLLAIFQVAVLANEAIKKALELCCASKSKTLTLLVNCCTPISTTCRTMEHFLIRIKHCTYIKSKIVI